MNDDAEYVTQEFAHILRTTLSLHIISPKIIVRYS
jgi:hypothetical protein